MKQNKTRFAALIIALVALTILGGTQMIAGANEPGASRLPQDSAAIYGGGGPGPVDNWFTYQGYLEDNGTPVNDTCDFQFSLWDSSGSGVPPTGGIQIGTTETASGLAVSEGLFNHTLNTGDQFGAQAFNGQRRYLQIAARCPAGSGGYTTLAPRQLLTGAPYALSLRPGAVISDTKNSALLTVINTNAANTSSGAIYARGSGPTAPVIAAYHAGVGHALYGSSESVYPTIGGVNSGSGTAVDGRSTTGMGVYGSTGTTSSVGVAGAQSGYAISDLGGYWKPGGFFGGRNGVVGITKANTGYGVFGWDQSASGGWAGFFLSTNGNGVYISAPTPNSGLNVAGGTKNAIVRTDSGSRLMYSEESTDVWFSDYGFGQLVDGSAMIKIDPIFAQTVNLSEPYHVFLQAYADADLYVSDRSTDGFEVHLRAGEANAEFSYRIVAKRLGYENARMEPAPWADNDPNLYPEKANEAMQTPQGGQP
jgi:hypothetical protein